MYKVKDIDKAYADLVEKNKLLESEIETLSKVAAEYEKENEFEFSADRPLMIWKLGDHGRGWIPGREHFAKAVKFVKSAKLDKQYNVFIYHYGLNIEVFGK